MTTSKKQGNEMFSVDKNGKKIDAHLHDPILDNPEAEHSTLAKFVKRLRDEGYPESMIRRVVRNAEAEEQRNENVDAGVRKYAAGGHVPHYGGMIKSSIPGRTDKIPLNVPAGSYILPADIPSALGQNNSQAGEQILTKMFKMGPYGSGATGKIKPGHPHTPRFNWMRPPRKFRAEGGDVGGAEEVPIIAAGAEFIIPPEIVTDIGHGDMNAGHRVLDKFVLSVRKRHIDTLKKLKPPKR